MFERSTSAFNIYAFRFFYCSILSYFLFSRSLYFWSTKESGIFQGLLVLRPFTGIETAPWQFYLSLTVLCSSLLLAALNWRPQLMLLIALLSHFNIYAPMNLEFRPYDDNIVFFNLLVMALYPNPISKTAPAWMFEFIKLNIALAYFSAFVSKMLNSGLEWAEGYTLQNYLFERHFMTGNQLALFVAENSTLCMLLSIGTLIAEAFFWVVLIPGRIATFTAWAGFFMHIGIYFMMSINFKVFALSYLVFIPYEKIYRAISRRFPQLSFNN